MKSTKRAQSKIPRIQFWFMPCVRHICFDRSVNDGYESRCIQGSPSVSYTFVTVETYMNHRDPFCARNPIPRHELNGSFNPPKYILTEVNAGVNFMSNLNFPADGHAHFLRGYCVAKAFYYPQRTALETQKICTYHSNTKKSPRFNSWSHSGTLQYLMPWTILIFKA